MKTLLLFFILLSTSANAQLSKLIERYPDLDTLQVAVDKAPYYASPNSTVPNGKLALNTIVYALRFQRGYFVIADNQGEFIGYIEPKDVSNISKEQMEMIAVEVKIDSVRSQLSAFPKSDATQEEIMIMMLREMEERRKQEQKQHEEKTFIKGMQTVALFIIGAGIIWQAVVNQRTYDKIFSK